MKKILTVSLVAMMAVSTARADIASTEYVQGAVSAETGARTQAITALETAYKAADKTLTDNLSGVTTRVGTAEGKITSLEGTVAGHTQDIADINAELDTMAASETVTNLQNTVTTLSSTVSSNEADIEKKVSDLTTTVNGKQATLTTAQLAAVNSGVTSDTVAQVATNKNAISGLETSKENASNKADTTAKAAEIGAGAYPTVGLVNTLISTANNTLGIDVAANTQAIAAMDLTQVGADGSYIKTVKQVDGTVTATAEAADTTPTTNSKKMITSGGVYTALSGKQNNLSETQLAAANSGITSAKVTTYDGYSAKITAAQTQADKGVTDAAAAQSTANTASSNATSAKAVTDAITGAATLTAGQGDGNYVLTMKKDGSTITYKWEVIGRSY